MSRKFLSTTLCGFFVTGTVLAQLPTAPMEQEAKVTAGVDAMVDDRFSRSVAVSGDTAIVSNHQSDGAGADSNSGSAYLFERNLGGLENWGPLPEFTGDDTASGDAFGRSVSIDGDTVVIGAFGVEEEDCVPGDCGAAYIFERDHGGPGNWGQVTKITADDVAAGDLFGIAVAISGDTVVVGSLLADRSGSAYLFERDQGGLDNWGQVPMPKLTADDAEAGDQFGIAVAISGDTVIVGASLEPPNCNAGAAYIFARDQGGSGNWGQVTKLTAEGGSTTACFGLSVAIDNDTAIVGALRDDTPSNNSGAAYLFQRDHDGIDNWGQVARIVANDASEGDRFGRSVSLSGDFVIVGADHRDDAGNDSGAAYLFARDQGGADHWGQTQKIAASDAAEGDHFGIFVSLSDDVAIVGAYWDDDGGNNSGSAYLFRRSIFVDGFESGDTTAWSVEVPDP